MIPERDTKRLLRAAHERLLGGAVPNLPPRFLRDLAALLVRVADEQDLTAAPKQGSFATLDLQAAELVDLIDALDAIEERKPSVETLANRLERSLAGLRAGSDAKHDESRNSVLALLAGAGWVEWPDLYAAFSEDLGLAGTKGRFRVTMKSLLDDDIVLIRGGEMISYRLAEEGAEAQ